MMFIIYCFVRDSVIDIENITSNVWSVVNNNRINDERSEAE